MVQFSIKFVVTNFTLGEHAIYFGFFGGGLDSTLMAEGEIGVNESHNTIYPFLHLLEFISLGYMDS